MIDKAWQSFEPDPGDQIITDLGHPGQELAALRHWRIRQWSKKTIDRGKRLGLLRIARQPVLSAKSDVKLAKLSTGELPGRRFSLFYWLAIVSAVVLVQGALRL